MSCKADLPTPSDLKFKSGQTHVINIGIDDTVIVNVVHPGNDRLKTTTIFRPVGTRTEAAQFGSGLFFKTDWSVESSEILHK